MESSAYPQAPPASGLPGVSHSQANAAFTTIALLGGLGDLSKGPSYEPLGGVLPVAPPAVQEANLAAQRAETATRAKEFDSLSMLLAAAASAEPLEKLPSGSNAAWQVRVRARRRPRPRRDGAPRPSN